MQQHWYNETTYEAYVYRPDIAGGGVPLESDDQPREGFELMPQGWTPPAPPTPPAPADWNGWRFASMMYFESVFNAVSVVAPFRANSLMNMLMSAPNVDMANMIGIWNETMGMINTAGLNFAAINDSAIAHHIPLRIDGNGVITVA